MHTIPACTIENVDGVGMMVLVCTLGLMAEAGFVLFLKGVDYVGSIRERRLRTRDRQIGKEWI